MLDLKILGGKVLDGTGSPAVTTDVGIAGDTITAVGDLSAAEALHTLDLQPAHRTRACPPKPRRRRHTGHALARRSLGEGGTPDTLWLSPGFIDAHSHSDAYLLVEPAAAGKLYQGVTTEVVGNCGSSAAPVAGQYKLPSAWRTKTYPGAWTTVAEYRVLFDRVRPALNVVLLIGHNNLRAAAAGYGSRRVTGSEMREMTTLLERSLDEGGRGLSSGLIYMPGLFAPTEELVALAKVVARVDGVYASHMRNEGPHLLKAIEEAVTIGRDGGVRVQIAHLKTHGRSNWHLADQALGRIRSARAQGLNVAADRYPYIASWTDLDAVLPEWAKDGGRDALLARLRRAPDRARIREDLLASRDEDYWGTVVISATSHPDNKRFRGKRIPEVAEALGMEPVGAVLHVVESDETQTGAFFFDMNEGNMRKILREPYVMLGSDASLRSPTGPLSSDLPHPRAYGSFPRFLNMAVREHLLPVEEAVRKMTSLPADQFGLKDRGVIAEGMKADLVVFDPTAVKDASTYTDPHQLAQGMQAVIVNGVLTLDNGELTGDRSGRFL